MDTLNSFGLVVAVAALLPLGLATVLTSRVRRLSDEVDRWREQVVAADHRREVDVGLASESERIAAEAAGELQSDLDAVRKQLSPQDDDIRVQTGQIQSFETAVEKEREAAAVRERRRIPPGGAALLKDPPPGFFGRDFQPGVSETGRDAVFRSEKVASASTDSKTQSAQP